MLEAFLQSDIKDKLFFTRKTLNLWFEQDQTEQQSKLVAQIALCYTPFSMFDSVHYDSILMSFLYFLISLILFVTFEISNHQWGKRLL